MPEPAVEPTPPPPALVDIATPGGSHIEKENRAPAPPSPPPMALPPAPPDRVAVTVQPVEGAVKFCPFRGVIEKAPVGRRTLDCPGVAELVADGTADRDLVGEIVDVGVGVIDGLKLSVVSTLVTLAFTGGVHELRYADPAAPAVPAAVPPPTKATALKLTGKEEFTQEEPPPPPEKLVEPPP